MFVCPFYLVCLVPYALQEYITPLHYAAREGHTTCVECLLSTPGIDVDTSFFSVFFTNENVFSIELCTSMSSN